MPKVFGPAVVTGGASGLGLGVVRKLSEVGVPVVVLDRQAGPALDGVSYFACDVASETEVHGVMDRAAQDVGPARIVVNCAGIGRSARLLGRDGVHTLDLFRQVIDVNLIGTFNVLRLAVQKMASLEPLANGQRGVIINVASIAAFDGQIGQAAYAASKAGVAGMTLPLARELGKHAIRVVTVCPGVFWTPMVDKHVTPDVLDGLLKNAAWPKRAGHPDEFADFVLAIASNPMVNGEVIRLDGGLRMPPL
jgi:NAD(P)-dependent dehydrogenase (short-subunit alcohol dehydrogenase family)